MKKRSFFWDNYKGILIFLVVLGHFMFNYSLKLGPKSVADIANTFIHMFHMPAFVFCSGYLSKSERSRSRSGMLKLIIYYVIFSGVMFLYKYFVDSASAKLLVPYQTLWYLLSLITWRLIIKDVASVKGIIPITIAITLFCGFWSELGTDLLSIRRTIAFFIYFLLGYKMDAERIENFLENRSKKVFVLGSILSALFVAGMLYVVIKYNKYFPIASSLTYKAYDDAHNIYTRMFLMVVATVTIGLMFMIIPNRKLPVLTKWGRNSMTIFLCHRVITLIFDKQFPYKTFETRYYIYVAVASVLTCFVLGGDRQTAWLSKGVNTMADRMLDETDTVGQIMKTTAMVVLVIVMALVPYIDSLR